MYYFVINYYISSFEFLTSPKINSATLRVMSLLFDDSDVMISLYRENCPWPA